MDLRDEEIYSAVILQDVGMRRPSMFLSKPGKSWLRRRKVKVSLERRRRIRKLLVCGERGMTLFGMSKPCQLLAWHLDNKALRMGLGSIWHVHGDLAWHGNHSTSLKAAAALGGLKAAAALGEAI